MTDHEQSAFKGASSVRKPWPLPRDQITPEELAQRPWKYPQGRIPAEESKLDDVAFTVLEQVGFFLALIAISGTFWAFVVWAYRSIFND